MGVAKQHQLHRQIGFPRGAEQLRIAGKVVEAPHRALHLRDVRPDPGSIARGSRAVAVRRLLCGCLRRSGLRAPTATEQAKTGAGQHDEQYQHARRSAVAFLALPELPRYSLDVRSTERLLRIRKPKELGFSTDAN